MSHQLLKERILGEDKESADLDAVVHDAKDREATAINNGGINEQLSFLMQRMTETQILQELGIENLYPGKT